MKKFTMIIALVLMTAMPVLAEHVTPETARIVATTFLNNNGAKSIELTDLSEEAGFPNLYIFTADDCFVVMSADDCVKPILGYSLTGNFVAEEIPEGIHSWLQGYSDQIQYAIEHQTKASSETAGQWKALSEGKAGVAQTTVVGPLTQTEWDQVDPYNILCPLKENTRTTTGCVATAMAQIMKFWECPTTGSGSHSYTWNNQTLTVNFATTYDWNNMINTYGNSSTAEQITSVATLMYHCGVSINMEYNIPKYGNSNAVTSDVMSALQTYFGYAPNMQYKLKDEYADSLWIAMLKTELDEGRPLQYRGEAGGSYGGHSFICDGYDSDDYFSFNWGWGGRYNGYFPVNNLAPGNGGVYTTGESAIFGIEPIKTLPMPTLSATINQNTITLRWDAIEGATSYDVYKDNKKIKNTTSTIYRDSKTEFGVYYDYYVRAVFSPTTRSNPSNHIVKCPLYRDIKPSNLVASLENDNITLTWDGYSENLSTDLHYGTVMSFRECGTGASQDAYWGQRYPASMLSQLKGMSITKVTSCFYYKGNYIMYLFSVDPNEGTRVQLAEQTYNKSKNSIKWKEFPIDPPIDIDCSKDLWVVFYTSSSIPEPILTSLTYNQDDANDAKYISSTLDGLFSSESIAEQPVSWLIRTYVSDGSYSYNLYDGDTKVNGNEPISGTSYTVNNIPQNAALQYTVKTDYNQGESEASNMMGFIVGNAELKSLILNANDKMTLTEGSKLTVIKTLNSPSIDNLVLENGAQLFTNSKNVQASVKKSIIGHKEDKGGWNFIASPITKALLPDESDGLSGEFDLYRFNQSANGKEWQNYKNEDHTSDFVFEIGQGYLYANDKNVNLSFAGPLYNDDGKFDLSYNKGYHFAGWNLVGNPFPCNAYIDRPFYIIKDKQLVPYIGTDPIPPCTGVMVHSDKQGQTVNFRRIIPNGVINPAFQPNQLHITVVQNVTDRDGVSTTSVEDNAIVSFNEGRQLEKFVFDVDASILYIPQNDIDYAIATSKGQGEMPVNFRAAENGNYTLTVQPEGVEMNYLRLIDNITGNEVDLLAMPDYTFTAKTTDYPSRFRLLFSVLGNEDDNEANDDFAYYSNGEIRVVEMCNDASLQIVDMMGRVVLAHTNVARNVSTKGMTPGVYVLRLINGNNVKTQKIMVY